MIEVPDALRLAECLDNITFLTRKQAEEAAVELRRLHAENLLLQSEAANNARILGASAETELALRARIAEMEEQMAAIGAGGVESLRKRAAIVSDAQIKADAHDAERWMGIGKAIERACMVLPDNTEIIVSLEKYAGTVTMIDQDGNGHKNFCTDYGFAGVMNEAIDVAIAAQAKHGGV